MLQWGHPHQCVNDPQQHSFSFPGAYIYIEASSPRRIDDTARLISSVFPPMVYCLQFGFHAWGSGVGKLAVYKKDIDDKRERIFTMDKNYGNAWHFASVTVADHSQFMVRTWLYSFT